MCLSSNSILQDSARRIVQLKGRFAGKTCVVIGNGPSLRVSDLEQLQQSYTFGVNKIYDLYPITKWRPSFYVMQDFKMMKAIFQEAEYATRTSSLRFFNARILEQSPFCIPTDPEDFYFKLKNQWKEDPKRNAPSFSEDISVCTYEGYTVLYSVLQIAVYMGFSRIYLLGVDHRYSVPCQEGGTLSGTSAKDYFPGYRPIKDALLNAPRMDRSTIAYAAAKAYCDAHRIRVFNATRGGCLEIFPRIPFEQI